MGINRMRSFMAVCGGYALHLEMNGIIPVSDIIRESGNPAAVVAIVSTLPGSTIAIAFSPSLFYFSCYDAGFSGICTCWHYH